MKKLIFCLLVMALIHIKSLSNVVYPQAYFSEIAFDSVSNWILELTTYDNIDDMSIDSIVIESCSGVSKIAHLRAFPGTTNIIVIRSDSLVSPLVINRDSDLLIINTYINHDCYNDHLYLGSYGGSVNWFIPENYSIALARYFCDECVEWTHGMLLSLDKSPTFGEPNTQDGVGAFVSGYLYDSNYTPLPNTDVIGYYGCIKTDENGYYFGKVLSRPYVFNINWNCFTSNKHLYKPDTLLVLPDSTYINDLVLLSVIEPVSIDFKNKKAGIVITSFPNPFVDEVTFYLTIPEDVSFSNARLEFYDMTGNKIYTAGIFEHNSKITFSGAAIELKPGNYYSLLIADGLVLAKSLAVIKL